MNEVNVKVHFVLFRAVSILNKRFIMKQPWLLVVFIVLTGLTACNRVKTFKTESGSNKKIARAYDQFLYLDEIRKIVPSDVSASDSVAIVKAYIDNWINKRIVLNKAEGNLANPDELIQDQMMEYRNSLIIYLYEQELINEKLDTNVTAEEIERYYNKNQQNFLLKQNIVKAIYLKVQPKTKNLDKLRLWLRRHNEKDRESIESFCSAYSYDFFLNDDQWLLFDDLARRLNIVTYNQEQFLNNNRFIELNDSTNITFVRFTEFKIRDTVSPLDFEKENIKAMIINKRKIELINSMERAAYESAKQDNEFEIFKN